MSLVWKNLFISESVYTSSDHCGSWYSANAQLDEEQHTHFQMNNGKNICFCSCNCSFT